MTLKKLARSIPEINIGVQFYKEGKMFIAYSQALDLSTCGKTYEEAKKNFAEALEIFLEECISMGTLPEVLESCGWQKVKRHWQPPIFIGTDDIPLSITSDTNEKIKAYSP